MEVESFSGDMRGRGVTGAAELPSATVEQFYRLSGQYGPSTLAKKQTPCHADTAHKKNIVINNAPV